MLKGNEISCLETHIVEGWCRMPESIPLPPTGFDNLTIDQKLEYVQSLWNRIAEDEGKVPVPNWHKQIIQERLIALETKPEDVYDWEEVRSEIKREIKKRL